MCIISKHTAQNGCESLVIRQFKDSIDSQINFNLIDTIKGEGGNDSITGGTGVDSIDAGADNDTINWADGDGNDSLIERSKTEQRKVLPRSKWTLRAFACHAGN